MNRLWLYYLTNQLTKGQSHHRGCPIEEFIYFLERGDSYTTIYKYIARASRRS